MTESAYDIDEILFSVRPEMNSSLNFSKAFSHSLFDALSFSLFRVHGPIKPVMLLRKHVAFLHHLLSFLSQTILKSHHLNGTVCESRYLLEQLSVYAICMRRRCQLSRVRKHRSGLKRNFYPFLALKNIFRLCVSRLLLNHKRPFIKAIRFHGHLSPEPRLEINFAEASCIRLPLYWSAREFF